MVIAGLTLQSSKSERAVGFALSISCLIFMFPSLIWNYIPLFNAIGAILFFSVLLYTSIYYKINYVFPFFIYLFYYFYGQLVGASYLASSGGGLLLIAAFYILINDRIKLIAFSFMLKILTLLIGISLFFYLLYIIGIYKPSLIPISGPDERQYSSFPFNVILDDIIKKDIFYNTTGYFRFHSIFSEPGFLGTFCGLTLALFNFDLKNQKFLYVYLISGILSMSLAFFLMSGLSLILTLRSKRIIYVLLLLFPIAFFAGDIIEKKVFSRFNLDGGKVSGDNRTSKSFDIAWSNFINSDNLMWGLGNGAHTRSTTEGEGTSSWKTIVYNNGVIGFGLYLSIFLVILFLVRGKNRMSYIFFIIFIMNIYHRPNVHQIYYLSYLFSGLIIQSLREKQNSTLEKPANLIM